MQATVADLGLRRDEIHQARRFFDAEAADPGATERAVNGMVERGGELRAANCAARVSGPKSRR